MNSVNDGVSTLRDKIWFTRKAWINAESRLLSNELHTQFLMVVYSVYSVCLSVVLLKFKLITDDAFNIFSINLSVVLLGLALYLNTRTFKDRAQQFKNGYIKLQDIDSRLSQISIIVPPVDMIEAYNNQFGRYNLLLGETENHSEFDDLYSRYRAGSGLTSRKLMWKDFVKITIGRLLRVATLVAFYIGPILAFAVLLGKEK